MKATLSEELAALLKQIESHSFDAPGASQHFADRLAMENGWTAAFTRRAIREYLRFAFLFAATGQPVAPSEVVDRVWHLHLLYTRNYWDIFCAQVMKRPLHHEPANGMDDEKARLGDWYVDTLARYRQHFGDPPAEIWPDPQTLARTPRAKHRWIELGDSVVFSRKTVNRLTAAVALLLVSLIVLLAWSAGQ